MRRLLRHASWALLIGAVAAGEERELRQPFRITPRQDAQHVSLDGRWQLGFRDAAVESAAQLTYGVKWFEARVPSSVQWALFESGRLPHPYHNLNSAQYDWVDERVWYYRRAFVTPAGAAGNFVFLCFDGVDYFARVWLNGQPLGRHEGMFGGPSAEVGGLLRADGTNEVVVEVRAGNYGSKAGWGAQRLGRIIRPWIISRGNGAEAFFPVGIWQGVRLEVVPKVHLERPFLKTLSAGEAGADLGLSVEVLAGCHSLERRLHPPVQTILNEYRDGAAARPLKEPFALRIEMTERASGRTAFTEAVPITLHEGANWVRRAIRIAKPRLWWPNGLGQPDLYAVRLTLEKDGRPVDTLRFDYGIRTVETRPSGGPQTIDRWRDWQFVVNGRPLFVKGINWTMVDVLLDTPVEKYRWLLEMARDAGIQWVRANGAFLIETETFHRLCDELGLMVEQDFPMGNQDYPDWPQDVWEEQVMWNIFRIRNHPSVVLWTGGNEFNPYSRANTPIIGILERALRLFDGSRPFLRSDPDEGAIHTYLDTDPAWYARIYRHVPFLSETGMHNIPEGRSIREVVDARELEGPFRNLFSEEFAQTHAEFRHHFVEFRPDRVPRMISRASHIDDMSGPSLEELAEASQIGAGEFYQVVSDGMQANYPATTGLLPWVLQRPWPAVAIMLVDGFGQPTAPYYFLKRTYEETHVAWLPPHLLWATGESLPAEIRVIHAGARAIPDARVSLTVFDARFRAIWKREAAVEAAPGPSVARLNAGAFTIPSGAEDQFFFLVVELNGPDGRRLSRSVYWPRCLKMMSEESLRTKLRGSPQPWPALDRGPWLKRQVAASPSTLSLRVKARGPNGLTVTVRNGGAQPAFPVEINVEGGRRAFYASDNFFWLAPAEERDIEVKVFWRDAPRSPKVTAKSWNATLVEAGL